MSKIIRTEPNKILAQAVEFHGFVYCAGVTAKDLSKDVRGQTKEVLDQIDHLLETHGTDKTRAAPGADLAEGHPRPRRHERPLVGLAARRRRPGPRLRAGQHGRPTAPGGDNGYGLQMMQG